MKTPHTLTALFLVLAVAAAVVGANPPTAQAAPAACTTTGAPLRHAHSHNDYTRDVPLCDALSHGFTSVEADVYVVWPGLLLIGHDRDDALTRDVTLQQEYLDPLRELIASQGSVYPGSGQPFQLVIDVKGQLPDQDPDPAQNECVDDAGTMRHDLANVAAWRSIHDALAPLDDAGYLSTYDHGTVQERALKIMYSGAVPRPCVAGLDPRPEFFDGSPSDPYTPAQMPIVNAKWEDVSTDLGGFVNSMHAKGELVRIWFGDHDKDTETSWTQERTAGVDLIGTDHLTRLDDALRPHDASYGYVSVPGAGAFGVLGTAGVRTARVNLYDTTPRDTTCANVTIVFGPATSTPHSFRTCDQDSLTMVIPSVFDYADITVATDDGASATERLKF